MSREAIRTHQYIKCIGLYTCDAEELVITIIETHIAINYFRPMCTHKIRYVAVSFYSRNCASIKYYTLCTIINSELLNY